MSHKIHLSNEDIGKLAEQVAADLRGSDIVPFFTAIKAYPIPRGGVPAAYALQGAYAALYGGQILIVDKAEDADIFIDDIIDSGETMRRYCDDHPGKLFVALIDREHPECPYPEGWIVFPWEATEDKMDGITDNITRILQHIGDDPKRGGLLETPARVAKAYAHWFSGYGKDPAEVFKTFEDGAEKCDEMVVVKDIPLYSKCEHHMADIFGTVTIAYIPDGKIIGLSKFSRLVEIFARRLQVQERLTNQIADALVEHLQPLGAGVIIKARHMCMESRGIQQQGVHTITSATRGVFRSQPEVREEFLSLAK